MVAADVNLRLSDALRFKAEVAFSDTREPRADWISGGENFKGRTAVLDGERYQGVAMYGGLVRQSKHWTLRADMMGQSPTFRAEMGFEPRNDWMRYELGASYNGFPNKNTLKPGGYTRRRRNPGILTVRCAKTTTLPGAGFSGAAISGRAFSPLPL